MSKETPLDDPREQTDWGSHKQTDKPWKGNPEKEQRPGRPKPDLEKWMRPTRIRRDGGGQEASSTGSPEALHDHRVYSLAIEYVSDVR